jgi:hypothetical protein
MKKLFYLFIISILTTLSPSGASGLFAQSVTIDPSATGGSNIIQASTPNKALKLPSVAGTSNIGSPQAGQLIYNQSTASPNFYNGTSWQNVNAAPVPSNIFPNSKHFGDNNNGRFNGTGNSTDDYSWICPAGVSRIWVESWSSGGSANTFTSPLQLPYLYYSGHSGSYLSAIINVIPGNTYLLKIGKGTRNSSNGQFGIANYIQLGSPIIFGNNQHYFNLDTSSELIRFQSGNPGANCKFWYETFYTGTTPNNVRFYQGGNGGNAPFGGNGGKGTLVQADLNSFVIATNNWNGSDDGYFPGGGGGTSSYANSCANGLKIIHW